MGDAMQAETIEYAGHSGASVEAYLARPLDPAPRGGVVVIHHMPGYDEGSKEIARRFAAHGYLTILPNLYSRLGIADPVEAAAENRASGGVPDSQLVGDIAAAADYLRAQPQSNGKVGVIGYCSGGRQAVLVGCALELDAAIDCYGGSVTREPPASLGITMRPVVGTVDKLSCPLLGLFGVEDANPSPEDVDDLKKALEAAGKPFDFHTFEDAGHAFFAVDRPNYRTQAALDGWLLIWDFFGRTLS